jgi:methionyl-tRNA synthetase
MGTSKNFYITTAIPYVNGKPHLGHAILHLYADVLARYHRAKGEDVLFSSGTDEHGGKIAEAAQKAGVPTKQFVDDIAETFRAGLKELGISNDRFIRTTDAPHEQRSQIIWKHLQKDIYKKAYSAMYCVGCEEFKTDTYVKETKGVCPLHNRPYDKIEEENYFFALSKYQDQIKTAIDNDSFLVTPKSRKHEILSVINAGLQDISISRPADKISWGIPVPGDPTQVMYVWFEALLNYITVIGYPEHADFAKYWPANVQVIGKDILRFHAAIWPGILLGLGVALPKTLYVHGFVTSAGQKMSKTLGNVVDPHQIVQEYGLDAFRYFFLRYGPSNDDTDFTWERFENAYNNELANELGNGVQRVVAMINKYQEGIIGDIPPAGHDMAQYHEAVAACKFDVAMSEVWEQVRGLNQYIEVEKPWAIAKEGDTDHLREVLSYLSSCLLEVAGLLEPFLPTTSTKIYDILDNGIVQQKEVQSPLFPKIYKHTEAPAQRG